MLTVLSSECSTEGAWDNFCRDRVHSSHLGFASIRYMWASILSLNCKNNIILFCTIIVSFWQSPMAGPPISTSSNSSLNQEMKTICFLSESTKPISHNSTYISNNTVYITTTSMNPQPRVAIYGYLNWQMLESHLFKSYMHIPAGAAAG